MYSSVTFATIDVTESQSSVVVEPQSNPPPLANRPEICYGLPELLAPAGDWDCAKAAVENGADAIYFGLDRFNARMRAQNFTEADLPSLMQFLHRRGVKGYVTLNTLVFQNELGSAEQYVKAMILAGVDAVIVQDVGLCRLIRAISPDFPIHASTQMTITSTQGVAFARELGCSLVVLARECSIAEIEKIQAASRTVEGQCLEMPLEVFVHGALCVAYSGQCLTSEALGGRSANRGECAQACRMPYELISDGRLVELGDRRYLLSPQDLAGLEVLPELMRLGIASLKIEGRLKSPEYVANITRVYRRALSNLGHQLEPSDPRRSIVPPDEPGSLPLDELVTESRYDLEMAFSRGLHTGWFEGINNQRLVHARFGKKRGVYVGEVRRVAKGQVIIVLEGPLKPGDGVVFDGGHPEQKEEGGRIYSVAKHGEEAVLTFGHGDIDSRRIQPGDKVWKTSDPALENQLRATYHGEQPKFRRPIDLEVHGEIGLPLTLIVRDDLGNVVQANSKMALAPALEQPLTSERLQEQLGRLGGTAFKLRLFRNALGSGTILPISELNRMRRECIQQLEKLRAQPRRWTVNEPISIPYPGYSRPVLEAEPLLHVLVRSLGQLDTVLQHDPQTIYCEFEDPKLYRNAVAHFREWQHSTGTRPSTGRPAIFVAPPRIFKPGEEWILKQVQSSNPDGYLIRNYDHLRFFRGSRCIGDYSFNVANALSAAWFHDAYGLERMTASYDLNAAQLQALLEAAPADWFEVTLHQHVPMFHMEHCVFCAFLSKGTDYTNCGRPCDHHQVQLRDRVGAEHPIKADAGCRNTVFNARAQTGAEHVAQMRALGVRNFRIEFLNETPEIAGKTLQRYRALLNGQITGSALWTELRLVNQLGVTRGQINKADTAHQPRGRR